MNEKQEPILQVTGEVASARKFNFRDMQQISAEYQVADFTTIEPNRGGIALKLKGILEAVQVAESANYLGLHSSQDDFHASIPLDEVRERGYFIYGLDGAPLPQTKGGPLRFYIPDHAQCNTEDIDECANVKYVDHIELTATRGFDNRPTDEEEHAKLHDHE